MKHAATRELFDYWDALRGAEIAPSRDALSPEPIRHLIGDMFLLSSERGEFYPIRVIGTRICALAGRDIKGQDFLSLWDVQSRHEMSDLLAIATEETIATVAGVTLRQGGHFRQGSHANQSSHVKHGSLAPRYLELLLLPFVADPAAARPSVAGALVPLTAPAAGELPFLHDLTLTSWRHLGYRRPTLRQRTIRKLAIAKGFMIYEGSGRDI